MSSRTAKSRKKNKPTSKSKAKPKSKPKSTRVRPQNQQNQNPDNEELNETKRIAKEEALAHKLEAEEKEKQHLLELQRDNEAAHKDIINDYIAKFVDGKLLQDIQNMEDVNELEQHEKSKPRHPLTSFLEVLLDCEPNKRNLHRILTDQFLDNPTDFEALITQDDIDFSSTDYGLLDYEQWELDDNEVKRLMSEWRRNVLDPVMFTYQDRMLPWCPNVPIALEIYDSFDDDDDEDEEDENLEQDEETLEIPANEPILLYSNTHSKVKQVIKGKKRKKKKKKSPSQSPLPTDEDIAQEMDDIDEDETDLKSDDEDEESEEEVDVKTDEEEESEDHGSLVSESMDEDDDDEEEESESESDEADEKTDDEDDDEDEDEEDDEDDDDDEDEDNISSGDSGDSGDDIDWKELTHEEALAKDKFYRFGKRLTAASFPQYVLQNIPSRFMSVNEEFNEQTHMAPVPWKRIFYHYNGDKISLPNNAAQKTVESEYKKIDFEVIEWDKIPNNSEHEQKDDDIDIDIDIDEVVDEEDDIAAIDKILQEIPDDYDDILDCSLEVHLEDVYNLARMAKEKASNAGKKQLGEMMQTYVDKFQCDPLPKNLCTDTYKQPRFVANFSCMKKYNEYCLINTKFDKMVNAGDSDDSSEEDDEDIVQDKSVTDDIAWSPWWTYRVRIWAKFTDKDWREVNETKDESDSDMDSESESESDSESESESESDSEDDSDDDDDDDVVEKAQAKREEKIRVREEKKRVKEEKRVAKLNAKMVKKKPKRNGRYFTSKLSSDDPVGYKLLCDHFVVQNDHCFGRPSRFYWDTAIHEDYGGGSMDHRFGDFLTEDINELGYNFPDLEHPLYIHPGMVIQNDLSGGIFCNGLAFVIGKDIPYDLISIDVRVPPVSQIYNMATEDAWIEGWGLCSISPYKAWRESGDFVKGVYTYGDRMYPEYSDLEDGFVDNDDDDGNIEEGFVLLTENLPFECNAFYLNNHYLRLFGCVDPSISSSNIQSDGYTLFVADIYDNVEYNHGKEQDEWVITVGFTHPRPHNQPCIILYKNNSIEIRLKSEYDYVNSSQKDKRGHMYKQEILEIYLIYMTRGGKRDKVLSMPIRQHFSEDYIIHNSEMVVVGDECVESHILILCKNKRGEIKAYLNGRKVVDKKVIGNNSTHLLQKSKNETNNNLPFQLMIGHKRTGDDGIGQCVDYFHGYLYDIGVFPYCPFEFEINLMYRSLKLDHDIHLRQHWDLQQKKYKRENANLNFKID